MATPQITILNTNARPDGSFLVSGVFWLVQPVGRVVPDVNAKSSVPNPPADIATMLRAGNIVETLFTSSLFAPGTDTSVVKAVLQDMYASAQHTLETQSTITGLVGTSFDGSSWNMPTSGSLETNAKIGSQYTQRIHDWSTWKQIQIQKNGIYQSTSDASCYTVWFYDGPEVHIATVWKGAVPVNLLETYSQQQNDIDKADFETNYFANTNKVIDLKTSDGRINVAPNAFPSWVEVFFTGRGDDFENGVIGAGSTFTGSLDAAGDVVVSWQFIDTLYVLGGIINFTGAQIGDYLDYYVTAGPTLTGVGTQQVDLVDIGPGNIIIPSPTVGMTTVNLSSSYVPVPNLNSTGFWDWPLVATGVGTVVPNYDRKGGYDLYDFTIPLAHMINNIQIVGDNRTLDLMVESVTSKQLLPHWTHVATIHNTGHVGLRAGWTLVGARARTY